MFAYGAIMFSAHMLTVRRLSTAEPFSGGTEVAELVNGELVDAKLKRLEWFLLACLDPFKWGDPRRDMRIIVLARLLLHERIDILEKERIKRRPGRIRYERRLVAPRLA